MSLMKSLDQYHDPISWEYDFVVDNSGDLDAAATQLAATTRRLTSPI